MTREAAELLTHAVRRTGMTTIGPVDVWMDDVDPEMGTTWYQEFSYVEGSVNIYFQEEDAQAGIYFYQGEDVESSSDYVSLQLVKMTAEDLREEGEFGIEDTERYYYAIIDEGDSLAIAKHGTVRAFMEQFNDDSDGMLLECLKGMAQSRRQSQHDLRSAVIAYLIVHLGSQQATL